MFSEIVSVATAAGSVGTALGLIYLAKQAIEAEKQSELSYHLSVLQSHNRLSDMSLLVDQHFMDYPDNIGFFYASHSHFAVSEEERRALRTSAEFINDIIENIMMHNHFLRDSLIGNWEVYCQEFIQTSPVLREFLHGHKHWYGPSVGALLKVVIGAPYRAIWADHVVRDYDDTIDGAPCSKLYEESFPAVSQREPSEFVFGARESNKRILVLRDSTDVIGLAVVYLLHKTNGAYLKYICIDEKYRSQGLGSTFMREVELFTMDQGRDRLLLDIEIPLVGEAGAQAASRAEFYRRLGYDPIDVFQFRIPNVSGGAPVPMTPLNRKLCGQGGSPEPREQIDDIFQSCFGWFPAESVRLISQDVCSIVELNNSQDPEVSLERL